MMKSGLPFIVTVALATPLEAQDDADLAQQLTNPLADLISMPIQGNMDFGLGPGGGQRMFTNIQPAIPFNLNDDWNFQIAQPIKPGKVPISIYAGLRYYVERPDQGPEWGFRLGCTLLFPKG